MSRALRCEQGVSEDARSDSTLRWILGQEKGRSALCEGLMGKMRCPQKGLNERFFRREGIESFRELQRSHIRSSSIIGRVRQESSSSISWKEPSAVSQSASRVCVTAEQRYDGAGNGAERTKYGHRIRHLARVVRFLLLRERISGHTIGARQSCLPSASHGARGWTVRRMGGGAGLGGVCDRSKLLWAQLAVEGGGSPLAERLCAAEHAAGRLSSDASNRRAYASDVVCGGLTPSVRAG